METIEHFARISLVARMLGREHLLSRDEVLRLQGLRDTYGIAAPAPICLDPPADAADPTCQVIVAPDSKTERLVPDGIDLDAGTTGEIRLTYAQLTALIDEAVRQLAVKA
jgi:L-fuculose-phosphate aldolase